MSEASIRGASSHRTGIATARRLEPADIDWAAVVAVRSFLHDPGMAWVLPDADVRRRLGVALATALIRYACCDGLVEVDAGGRGLAIWFPPNTQPPQEPVLRQSGMWDVPRMIGDTAWARIRSLMSDLAVLHATRSAEPHWYLSLLGVDPDFQCQGIGTALMRAQLTCTDAAGLPCYLLTPTAGNVRFYEGRGFRIVTGTDVAEGLVHMRLMRRPANGG
ncbi:MAG TPA: GNAT family N-acetyltransferase [Geminicoccus sp.]|uniref:GNAT family N-acetyltransferase n=1 Tax=Geminicoccus sp. TaxID=2024832 RepID=UPI002D10FFE5|nr:GNAT family N-acetyltransferase [Geminicoccus sp.]HWL69684.1 GNAT family N-acetyltransferase [Geminicoccus sp.]